MTRTAIQACTIPHGGSIKEEMGLLPGEYAYWAGRLAEARTATAAAEAQADDAKSAALLSAKANAAPKATVDEIKASSLLSPDYINARNQAIRAKAAQHKLEAIVTAISQKRYMLMSLGAMIRFEGSQPPPTSPDDHDHPLSNMDGSNDE